jgi:MFS family permease
MPSTLLSISSLLLGAFILLMGNGLVGILLPVRAATEGFSTNVIGAVASAYSVGFVLSCFLTAHVVSRVGHIRTFAVLAAIGASAVLTMGLVTTPLTWIGLRAITGFCFAGLFMVIESWLNERASNQNRGQIFATYMVINMSAVTAGTMLLPVVTSVGITAFALICIFITLSLVPVSLTKSDAPTPMGKVRIRLIRLFRISPVGATGCLIVGLANGAYGGLGVIYAHSLGLSETEVALFMSAAVIGGAFAQIPLGRLSDRMDRRWIILAAVFFSAGLGMILATWGGLLNGMQSAEALTIWIKSLPPSASIVLIGF